MKKARTRPNRIETGFDNPPAVITDQNGNYPDHIWVKHQN